MELSGFDLRTAAVGFLVAAGIVMLLTPVVSLVAHRLALLDRSTGPRRLHRSPTPRLGGLAILAGVAVPALALGHEHGFFGIVAGAALMAALGAVDDVAPMTPAAKLLGQVAIAALAVWSGVAIDHATLPLVGAFDLGAWGWPVTIAWIVVIVNLVNFIDGMDGLAAGFCAIAALTFAVLAASLGRADAAAVAAIVAGASLGFLVHNFHPARIIMGDSGALMLGYLLATLAIQGVLKTAAAVSLLFPLVVLAVPILDTSFVVLKRLKYRRPIWVADAWHFHHRFATIGYGQRRAVLLLYGWCLALSAFALAVRFVPHRDGWDAASVAALGGLGAVALAVSGYVLIRLEVLKLRRLERLTRPRRAGERVPQSRRAA